MKLLVLGLRMVAGIVAFASALGMVYIIDHSVTPFLQRWLAKTFSQPTPSPWSFQVWERMGIVVLVLGALMAAMWLASMGAIHADNPDDNEGTRK